MVLFILWIQFLSFIPKILGMVGKIGKVAGTIGKVAGTVGKTVGTAGKAAGGAVGTLAKSVGKSGMGGIGGLGGFQGGGEAGPNLQNPILARAPAGQAPAPSSVPGAMVTSAPTPPSRVPMRAAPGGSNITIPMARTAAPGGTPTYALALGGYGGNGREAASGLLGQGALPKKQGKASGFDRFLLGPRADYLTPTERKAARWRGIIGGLASMQRGNPLSVVSGAMASGEGAANETLQARLNANYRDRIKKELAGLDTSTPEGKQRELDLQAALAGVSVGQMRPWEDPRKMAEFTSELLAKRQEATTKQNRAYMESQPAWQYSQAIAALKQKSLRGETSKDEELLLAKHRGGDPMAMMMWMAMMGGGGGAGDFFNAYFGTRGNKPPSPGSRPGRGAGAAIGGGTASAETGGGLPPLPEPQGYTNPSGQYVPYSAEELELRRRLGR